MTRRQSDALKPLPVQDDALHGGWLSGDDIGAQLSRWVGPVQARQARQAQSPLLASTTAGAPTSVWTSHTLADETSLT